MQGCDLAARGRQLAQSVDQRRLQRSNIEYQATGFQHSQLSENTAGNPERCGHYDDIEVDSRVGPVTKCTRAIFYALVGNDSLKSLRCEKFSKPATHLAGATDDQDLAAIALTFRDDPIPFLARER